MNQKNLALWLKLVIIGMAICGLGVYFYLLPVLGDSLSKAYPEFANRYYPWLIFLWGNRPALLRGPLLLLENRCSNRP